jgi:4-alpha-glucanotransferase
MIVRKRRSGLLLHLSSLPGKYGIGDLGPEAFKFIDQLATARQSIWQILPIGPTGYGDSPYQSFSSFAGNPLFVSPEWLVEEGLLPGSTLENAPRFPAGRVDFERVTPWRMEVLHKAFNALSTRAGKKLVPEFEQFQHVAAEWLDEFALFMALRDQWPDRGWVDWPEELRSRNLHALKQARVEYIDRVRFHQFTQFLFFRQWNRMRGHAYEHGISIFGDIPIFVSHESSDVWASQSLFQLDEGGRPTKVAGVPPDYFSETGQRWGNPLYDWDRMAAEGYRWWINRVGGSLKLLDLVRIDHFRGFEAYWEIPAEAPTAATGQWIPGPREKLFEAIRNALGDLPVVAENLGVITPPVEQLRESFGFPGMHVLQFAFSGDNAMHLPHNYERNAVAYTGTHDNDTTVGWFTAEPGKTTTQSAKEVAAERKRAVRYLNANPKEIHWSLIRTVWQSVSQTAVAPVQDVLGLGNDARMNLPGTASGNWRWRLKPGQLKPEPLARLAELTMLYDRAPRIPEPSKTAPTPAAKRKKAGRRAK